MTRLKKQAKLDPKVLAGFLQYLSEAGVDLGEAKVSKAKPTAKEAFVGQAKLVEALRVHYADFDGSKLAEASRRRNGRCGLYSLVMTWASQNKNVACQEWAERKGSSKVLRKWYNTVK